MKRKAANKRRKKCILSRRSVLIILGIGFSLAAGGFWFFETFFSLRSNLYLLAFQDSRSELQINTRSGWKDVSSVTSGEISVALETLHQNQGISVQKLSLRRQASGFSETLADWFLPSELMIFTFPSDKVKWEVAYRPAFLPSSAAATRTRQYANFAINANFFDPSGKPLGRVIHNRVEVNRVFPAWSGYFFVRDGRAWCGPRSLFESVPGVTEEGVQVYPSIMKDHTIFSYVEFQPDRYFDGGKITYRSLAGMRSDGSIILIVSSKGGVLHIGEIAEIAKHLHIQHATMLDGGRALQYEFDDGQERFAFHAYNNRLKLPWKRLDQVLCPVFLTVSTQPKPGVIVPFSAD